VNCSSVEDATLSVNVESLTVDHTGAASEDDPPPDCHTFADDRGDLVVKCILETVKGMVAEADEATFELIVTLTDGSVLTGEETIDVVDHGHDQGGNGGNGQGDCEDNGGGDNRGPGGKR